MKTLAYRYKITYVFYTNPKSQVLRDTTVEVLQKSELKAEDKFWCSPPGSILLRSPGTTIITGIDYLGEFFQ